MEQVYSISNIPTPRKQGEEFKETIEALTNFCHKQRRAMNKKSK